MQVVEIGDPDPPEDDALNEEADESESGAGEGDSAASAAKKKKKKKKKGGAAAAGATASEGAAPAATPPPAAEDGATRLLTALEALRDGQSPAPSDLALSKCGFGDKKLRQLLTALRGNGSGCAVASLDLSHNSISDAGATALCTALGTEAALAPRLGMLSLEGNPLSATAAAVCAAALEPRQELSLVLPASSAATPAANAANGSASEGSKHLAAYYAARASLAAEPPAKGGAGEGAGGEGAPEKFLLVGPSLSFEAATAILLRVSGGEPSASVDCVDALRSLISKVEAECELLAESPNPSAKFLPRTLKWLASNVALLQTLLQPPTRPRVTYGSAATASAAALPPDGDTWKHRLGQRRLLVIELLLLLILARRPPLTAAIADARPSLVCTALSLLPLHPRSSILAEALVRLLSVALQVKQLRASLLTTSALAHPSIPAMVASALAPELAPSLTNTPAAANGPASAGRLLGTEPARPVWVTLAGVLEQLAASDKQAAERMAAEPGWTSLTAALPAMQSRVPAGWACGDPPEKEDARSIGADSEMGELLRLLQSKG